MTGETSHCWTSREDVKETAEAVHERMLKKRREAGAAE